MARARQTKKTRRAQKQTNPATAKVCLYKEGPNDLWRKDYARSNRSRMDYAATTLTLDKKTFEQLLRSNDMSINQLRKWKADVLARGDQELLSFPNVEAYIATDDPARQEKVKSVEIGSYHHGYQVRATWFGKKVTGEEAAEHQEDLKEFKNYLPSDDALAQKEQSRQIASLKKNQEDKEKKISEQAREIMELRELLRGRELEAGIPDGTSPDYVPEFERNYDAIDEELEAGEGMDLEATEDMDYEEGVQEEFPVADPILMFGSLKQEPLQHNFAGEIEEQPDEEQPDEEQPDEEQPDEEQPDEENMMELEFHAPEIKPAAQLHFLGSIKEEFGVQSVKHER